MAAILSFLEFAIICKILTQLIQNSLTIIGVEFTQKIKFLLPRVREIPPQTQPVASSSSNPAQVTITAAVPKILY